MEKTITPKVLIAASGTGGHILPAVYVADALQALAPGSELLFVGSGRPLEEKLVEGNGYNRTVVPLSGVKGRGLAGLLQFVRTVPRALAVTWKLLSSYEPHIVIGVGGYVSVLPVLLGRLRGIPTWIHEAEHRPGLANWLLSFFADKISLAWDGTAIPGGDKTVVTGHPLRPELLACDFHKEALSSPARLLVLGGSQGSQSLDRGMKTILPWLAEKGVAVWHQCRPKNEESLRDSYQQHGIDAEVAPFINKMEEALQWSDVVLSRSGAGAARELLIAGRPAVFVPLPGSREQYDNAHMVVARGQAIVIEEGEGFSSMLQTSLEKLLTPEYYQYFQRSGAVGQTDVAAHRIAEGCLQLAATP